MFHFFKRKLRHYYISPLDLALSAQRKQSTQTPSQKFESEKHEKIMKLRDALPKDDS